MSETITLRIDAELQSLLTQKAAAEGVSVEQYAAQVLRKIAELPDNISDLFADVSAAFEESGITDEELEADIKQALSEVRAERRAK